MKVRHKRMAIAAGLVTVGRYREAAGSPIGDGPGPRVGMMSGLMAWFAGVPCSARYP